MYRTQVQSLKMIGLLLLMVCSVHLYVAMGILELSL